MTTRPIPFSGPMIRAILAGIKTQTRRVVKPPRHARRLHAVQCYPAGNWTVEPHPHGGWWAVDVPGGIPEAFVQAERDRCLRVGDERGFPCPYGQPGDRLWVRETWTPNDCDCVGLCQHPPYGYRADPWTDTVLPEDQPRWRPSRYMPRKASRITLELTAVRVEPLQAISGPDCCAEGLQFAGVNDGPPRTGDQWAAHRDEYAALWDRLNAARGYGWDVNPAVWVLTFRRLGVTT